MAERLFLHSGSVLCSTADLKGDGRTSTSPAPNASGLWMFWSWPEIYLADAVDSALAAPRVSQPSPSIPFSIACSSSACIASSAQPLHPESIAISIARTCRRRSISRARSSARARPILVVIPKSAMIPCAVWMNSWRSAKMGTPLPVGINARPACT